MPKLPVRFISSSGPFDPPKPDDVMFLGSTPDFAKADAKRKALSGPFQAEFPTRELVIYRLSRTAAGFFVWRQGPDSTGNDRSPEEPAGTAPIGYAVYGVPTVLANEVLPTPPAVSRLSEKVLSLGATFGQRGDQGDPGHGGP